MLTNEFMRGTDRMDQNVNCYRVNIRMKKWWWPKFSWLLDVTVENAWLCTEKKMQTCPYLGSDSK